MAMPRACEHGILLTVGLACLGGVPVVQTTRFAAHCEGAETAEPRRRSGSLLSTWEVSAAVPRLICWQSSYLCARKAG
jgi:hypothetical protein